MPGPMRGLGTHCSFQGAPRSQWKRRERGTSTAGKGVSAGLEGGSGFQLNPCSPPSPHPTPLPLGRATGSQGSWGWLGLQGPQG